MNPGDIYVGLPGQETKLYDGNRTVTPIPVKISVSNRSVSGVMLEDIIRRYVNYQVDYGVLPGTAHNALKALYDIGQNLNFIIVHQDGMQEAFTASMTWTSGSRKSTSGGWTWDGDSILFEVI